MLSCPRRTGPASQADGRAGTDRRLPLPQHLSPWIKSPRGHERARALGLSAHLLQYFLEHLHVSVSARRPFRRCPALFLGPSAWGLLGVAPMSQGTPPASWHPSGGRPGLLPRSTSPTVLFLEPWTEDPSGRASSSGLAARSDVHSLG